MKEELKQLELDGSARIAEASDLKSLEEVRVAYLGRKGRITEILKGLGSASPEDRRSLGQMANLLKDQFAQRIDARKTELEAALREQKAQEQRVDMSLPGRAVPPGHVHVLNQIADEISDIFIQMGFQLALGPDVETEYYNFDALNTPDDHPARDSHDTFFVKPGVVLRTQTSPVQIGVMEQTRPPVAVIAPGRVYRVDLDATHSPMFV
jgi:phenylalanyl-tRNA synthetase alpha chain